MDHLGPQRTKEIYRGEAQKKIAEPGGIENAGIQQRRDCRHTTLVELEFLGLTGQEIESFVANRSRFALVFQQGRERNPAMCTNLSERDLTLLKQPNDKGPRDV
jgi:hypothetical protein